MFNPNKKESFNFTGFYRGIVEDVIDPLKNGRIKVRIYPVFKDLEVIDLPWAIFADPNMGGKANMGGFNVPELQSHVFCFFEGDDHRFPVYFAGAPAIENDVADVPTESRTNGTYPKNKVYKTAGGIVIEIDDSPGARRYKITHPTGNIIEMKQNGDISVIATNKITINSTSDTDITASGNVNVTGTTINLN